MCIVLLKFLCLLPKGEGEEKLQKLSCKWKAIMRDFFNFSEKRRRLGTLFLKLKNI